MAAHLKLIPTPAETDVRLRLADVRLPALPEILLKLLALYRREDVQLSEFLDLISQDAAMAAKVMAAANGAAFRQRGPVQSLDRAVMLLGTEAVRTLVISQSIFQTFYSVPALRSVDLRAFWRHAFLTATVARDVAKRLDYPRQDEAYLAGLLHDVGRLGLLAAAPAAYAEGFLAEDDEALCELERRLLHLSHAEAGAWLVERWQLDGYLADSVRYHHEPLRQVVELHPLLRIVVLAHRVAAQLPEPDQPLAQDLLLAGWQCGLTSTHVLEVAAGARARLNEAAEQLGLDLSPGAVPAGSTASADRLWAELSPMMVAAAVMNELVPADGEPELLRRLGDAARIVFQFDRVVAMLPDAGGRGLRLVGPNGPPDLPVPLAHWNEFSLPLVPGSDLAEGLGQRRPIFLSRARADLPTAIAEDQLLRLLGADHLVCLPLGGDTRPGGRGAGALVCAGSADLMASLQRKRALLIGFIVQAQAVRSRALAAQAIGERERADLAARHALGLRDLAHEVNNPLSIIQNYLSLLDVKLAAGPSAGQAKSVATDIAMLQAEVARVGRLVQALGTPAADAPAGVVDVDALLAEVAQLFESALGGAGAPAIVVRPNPAARDLSLERDALKQVLVNLVKNAVEALRPSPPSEPSAPSAPDAAPDAAAVPPPGRPSDVGAPRVVIANRGLVNRDGRLMLEIGVRDNGPGMPAALLSSLFTGGPVPAQGRPGAEPGRGRGLGIVHGLVTGMGGLLQVRSGPHGTSVDVFLPYRQLVDGAEAP